MRRLTHGLLAFSIAIVMLVLSLSFRSEPLRAFVLLIAAGSLRYGWVGLQPRPQSRLGLFGIRLAFSMAALGCAWSGLNLARFYLYNPAIEGAAIYSTGYEIVSTAQVVIQWCLAVLAIILLVVLAVFPFARTNRGQTG